MESDDDDCEECGFEVELLTSSLDHDLVCAICQKIVEGPVELMCGHLFCKLHIDQWLAKNSMCPLCRQGGSVKDTVHFLYNNKLDAVRLKCINESCQGLLRLSEFRSHVASCPFSLRACRWSGCPRGDLLGSDALLHEENCEFRVVPCPWQCGQTVLAGNMAMHGLSCSSKPTFCPNGCGAFLPAQALASHRSECSHEVVVCEVPNCGASFPRHDLGLHTEFALASHNELLSSEAALLRKELQSCKIKLRNQIWKHCSPRCISPHEAIDVAACGSMVFSLLGNGRVYRSSIEPDASGEILQGFMEAKFSGVRSIAVSERYIVAGSDRGLARIWENDGQLAPELAMCAQVLNEPIRRVLLSPGRLWVIAESCIKAFALESENDDFEMVREYPLTDPILDACVLKHSLLCCNFRNEILLASPETMAIIRSPSDSQPYCVCSNDSEAFFGCSNGSVQWWRAHPRLGLQSIHRATTPLDSVVVSVAACPHSVAAAMAVGLVAVWAVGVEPTLTLVRVLRPPGDCATAVVFAGEDGLLVHQGDRLYVWRD